MHILRKYPLIHIRLSALGLLLLLQNAHAYERCDVQDNQNIEKAALLKFIVQYLDKTFDRRSHIYGAVPNLSLADLSNISIKGSFVGENSVTARFHLEKNGKNYDGLAMVDYCGVRELWFPLNLGPDQENFQTK